MREGPLYGRSSQYTFMGDQASGIWLCGRGCVTPSHTASDQQGGGRSDPRLSGCPMLGLFPSTFQKGALQINDLSPDEWPPPSQGLQGTPTHIFCNGILRPWVISMTTRVFPQALPPGCPSPLCSLRACRGSPGWVGSHWRLDTEGLLEEGRVGVCK